MKINRLTLIISFLTFSLCSYADLKVSNNTGETLMVAIGYIENNQHVSSGWYVLKQGETQTVITSNALKRTYYYYALDAKKQEYQGDEKFTVSQDNQFVIRPDNMASQKNTLIKGFKKVDLPGDGLKDYTLQIPVPRVITRVFRLQKELPVGRLKAPTGTHQAHEARNQ